MIKLIKIVLAMILLTNMLYADTVANSDFTIHPYSLSYSKKEIKGLTNSNIKRLITSPVNIFVTTGGNGVVSKGQASKNGVFQFNQNVTGYLNVTNRIAYGFGTGYATTFDNGVVFSRFVYTGVKYRFALDYEAESIPFVRASVGRAFNTAGSTTQNSGVQNCYFFNFGVGNVMANGLSIELVYNYYTEPIQALIANMPKNGSQSFGISWGYEFAL